MLIPLLYETAVEGDDDTCYRRFSLHQIHLLTIAMTNIANNASMFIADYPDFTADDIQTLLDKIVENVMTDITVETVFAEEVFRLANDLEVNSGYPLAMTTQISTMLNFYMQPTTQALGNIYEINTNMRQGEWEYTVMSQKFNTGAELAIGFHDPDGNITFPIALHNIYSASVVYNHKLTGSFTVPKSGLCKWYIGTNNLGAGAGTHGIRLTYVQLRRTGD